MTDAAPPASASQTSGSFRPVSWVRALPFWMTVLTVPVAFLGAWVGGWTVFLLPLLTWGLFDLLDLIVGLDESNADLIQGDDEFAWYESDEYTTNFPELWGAN